jgi:hypothetical protein
MWCPPVINWLITYNHKSYCRLPRPPKLRGLAAALRNQGAVPPHLQRPSAVRTNTDPTDVNDEVIG